MNVQIILTFVVGCKGMKHIPRMRNQLFTKIKKVPKSMIHQLDLVMEVGAESLMLAVMAARTFTHRLIHGWSNVSF